MLTRACIMLFETEMYVIAFMHAAAMEISFRQNAIVPDD